MLGELTWGCKCKWVQDDDPPSDQTTHACDGTRELAHPPRSVAYTTMSAHIAVAPTTSIAPVPTSQKRARITGNTIKPIEGSKSFNWQNNTEGISHLAFISELLLSLPSVPDEELRNDVVTKTISDNQHLFSDSLPS
jgi:hypothetical protein